MLARHSEDFGYDATGRLISERVDSREIRNLGYDSDGNVTNRSDRGKIVYGESGACPHCATRAILNTKSTSYSYNSMGEQTKGPNRILSYTPDGKPEKVETGGTLVTFFYGPLGNEYKTTVTPKTSGSAATTSITFNDLYQESTASDGRLVKLKFIWGRQGRVGCISEAGSVKTTYYFAADSLGSPALITDDKGTVVRRRIYDAWGERTIDKEANFERENTSDWFRRW